MQISDVLPRCLRRLQSALFGLAVVSYFGPFLLIDHRSAMVVRHTGLDLILCLEGSGHCDGSWLLLMSALISVVALLLSMGMRNATCLLLSLGLAAMFCLLLWEVNRSEPPGVDVHTASGYLLSILSVTIAGCIGLFQKHPHNQPDCSDKSIHINIITQTENKSALADNK